MPPAGPRRRRGRILYSICVLLFAIGVVPLLWTSYKLVTGSRESLELTQKQMQLDKARSLSSQVGLYVSSLRDHVSAIARTLEIDADREPFSDRLARITDQGALARYLDAEGGEVGGRFVYVSVRDTRGIGPASGLDLQDPDILHWLREGFSRGLYKTRMTSPTLVSTSLDEPVIVLEEPIVAGGKVLGVVLAVASLQPIRLMTAESGERGLLEVYLVDNRGRLIAHSDPEKPLQADMSSVEIVRLFAESGQQAGATIGFAIPAEGGARQMLGTYRAVPDDSGWGVIVQVDEETAYYDAIELRRQSVILVTIVTALAVVLGTLFAGQISRPVRRLADGARRLAGGDYGTRVDIRSENEMGVLADAFNQMGEEI